jgi:hypothetical protein
MLGSDVGQDGLMERKAFVVENCDYHEKTFPEVNAFKYVCGYLIKKCLQIHSCKVCIEFGNDDAELDHPNLFIHFKAYNKKYNTFNGLKTPHEIFRIPPPPGGTAILPEYIHYYGYYYQVIVQCLST